MTDFGMKTEVEESWRMKLRRILFLRRDILGILRNFTIMLEEKFVYKDIIRMMPNLTNYSRGCMRELISWDVFRMKRKKRRTGWDEGHVE